MPFSILSIKESKMESVILNLITNSGEAKSASMEAIAFAKTQDFKAAHESLENASKCLSLAHKSQTALIQAEAGGEKLELSMLLIHAQDHLMNAMTAKDLATEMVELYEILYEKLAQR